MDISQMLEKIINQNVKMSVNFGVVTARTNTNTRISMTLSGGTNVITGVRYLNSYTPTVNDVVVALIHDNDIIVLGKLV
jgi:hypothetical protein